MIRSRGSPEVAPLTRPAKRRPTSPQRGEVGPMRPLFFAPGSDSDRDDQRPPPLPAGERSARRFAGPGEGEPPTGTPDRQHHPNNPYPVRSPMTAIRLVSAALLLSAAPAAAAPIVVTFENPTVPVPIPAPDPFNPAGTRPFENGANLVPGGSFTSNGVTFNNLYDPGFDINSGWSYSRVTDVTTAGFLNQYAAYNLPGGGAGDGSANYGIAFSFSPGDAVIDLPAGFRPDSVRLTNTTFAALSILNGDQFARAFGPGDFFLLTISGTDAAGGATGSVDFFLADFRDGRSTVVSGWTTVDLSGLGADTARLALGFTSSDVGRFGINTPTYVAVDNLVLVPVGGAVGAAVPEPLSLALAAAAAAGWRRVRRAGVRSSSG
ncbi:MAG: hypothetical protein C0501_08360 [Isosphaera sp.]|nr:hypothetical protein [Isosphaera sp.]